MDDALVLGYNVVADEQAAVLILVVMDDALVHGNSLWQGVEGRVLILVVMDDALVLQQAAMLQK